MKHIRFEIQYFYIGNYCNNNIINRMKRKTIPNENYHRLINKSFLYKERLLIKQILIKKRNKWLDII